MRHCDGVTKVTPYEEGWNRTFWGRASGVIAATQSFVVNEKNCGGPARPGAGLRA
jgi:hypothetical protein